MRIINAPAVEPITLTDVRSQLGILESETFDETLAQRRIYEAREWAEEYMQRAIIKQTQEVRFNEFPHSTDYEKNSIKLPYPDLLSVVSIKYIDITGVEQTVASTDYVVDTYSLIGKVRPVYGIAWPYARLEANAVRIQYTCGYGDSPDNVPKIIKEALCLLVGHLMNKQTANENGVILSRIPFAIRDMFDAKRISEVV
jgi:uncharacterized phiE125 gp8 family phage protein